MYAIYLNLNKDLIRSLFKFVEYANHYVGECYYSDYYDINDVAKYFIENYDFIVDGDKIYIDIDEIYNF